MPPILLRYGPYEFRFYARDRSEPPHVHVKRDNDEAKFWLDPVTLARESRMRQSEIRRLQRIVEEHAEEWRGAWDEYFET